MVDPDDNTGCIALAAIVMFVLLVVGFAYGLIWGW